MDLFHICLITPCMGPCMGFQAVAQWERIPPSLLEGENTDYLDIPDQPYRDGTDLTQTVHTLNSNYTLNNFEFDQNVVTFENCRLDTFEQSAII